MQCRNHQHNQINVAHFNAVSAFFALNNKDVSVSRNKNHSDYIPCAQYCDTVTQTNVNELRLVTQLADKVENSCALSRNRSPKYLLHVSGIRRIRITPGCARQETQRNRIDWSTVTRATSVERKKKLMLDTRLTEQTNNIIDLCTRDDKKSSGRVSFRPFYVSNGL